MAEGGRFELPVGLEPYAGFQNRCLRPLGHPSGLFVTGNLTGAANTCCLAPMGRRRRMNPPSFRPRGLQSHGRSLSPAGSRGDDRFTRPTRR